MTMRCISRCQWKGDIVHVGEVVDMDKNDLAAPIAKSAFVPAGREAAARGGVLVAGLTREQTILKLQEANVMFDLGADDETLAGIYLEFAGARAKLGALEKKGRKSSQA
jgi:hypothetical protein